MGKIDAIVARIYGPPYNNMYQVATACSAHAHGAHTCCFHACMPHRALCIISR